MLIIWKFPKSIMGSTKRPCRLHASHIFDTLGQIHQYFTMALALLCFDGFGMLLIHGVVFYLNFLVVDLAC